MVTRAGSPSVPRKHLRPRSRTPERSYRSGGRPTGPTSILRLIRRQRAEHGCPAEPGPPHHREPGTIAPIPWRAARVDGSALDRRRFRSGGPDRALLAIAVGWLFVLGGRFPVPVVLPQVEAAFDLGNADAGVAITALRATYALVQSAAGLLVDRPASHEVGSSGRTPVRRRHRKRGVRGESVGVDFQGTGPTTRLRRWQDVRVDEDRSVGDWKSVATNAPTPQPLFPCYIMSLIGPCPGRRRSSHGRPAR